MRFSILHVSDLHRDLADELDSPALLDSLERDLERRSLQDPPIGQPALCVVSGDLVYGVSPTRVDGDAELSRQYDQALELLIGLADRLFGGDRSRVVIVPGNHDVSYRTVTDGLTLVPMPTDAPGLRVLAQDLFASRTMLRWSWPEFALYRITDEDRYQRRFNHFIAAYSDFYQGRRTYSSAPDDQYDVFDFPELSFCVLALNSCHSNDPLRRAAAFHPTALTRACQAVGAVERTGWLVAATWHHSFSGGPLKDDYLDSEILQLLIQAGVSIGFHGHQHIADCVDERYRIGTEPRKLTGISAGTLCSGPNTLRPGVPRSYNIIDLNTDAWLGRVHQRQMANHVFTNPIWGPGHLPASNASYIDFAIHQPLSKRPSSLDTGLTLERADALLGAKRWAAAADLLDPIRNAPVARIMQASALTELGDFPRILTTLWPPETAAEAVLVGGAILETGNEQTAHAFRALPFVASSTDASVEDVARRIAIRWPQ